MSVFGRVGTLSTTIIEFSGIGAKPEAAALLNPERSPERVPLLKLLREPRVGDTYGGIIGGPAKN